MSQTNGVIRVLIVDDDSLFRELLELALSTDGTLEVVGSAADGETGVRMAKTLAPDVVLMDIEMPGTLNGIQAAEEIQDKQIQPGIVLLSAHDQHKYARDALERQGAGWSYLLKQSVSDVDTLVRAIEGSARGLVVLDPGVLRRIRPKPGSRLTNLRSQELRVLELMAQGLSNVAIAEELFVGQKTVENYSRGIYQVLGLSRNGIGSTRVQAVLAFLSETQEQ